MSPVPSKRHPSGGKPDDDGDFSGVVKSAKRVLELLDFFVEQRKALTVNDVVHGLGYPQSSTSALLKSLARLGYLDYDRYSRQYKPTLRIALLGGWVQDEMFSQASLSRVVDDLHAQSGQSVIIGMQNEIYVQYIHLAQALNSPLPGYVKPGSLRPLCRAAMGKMLLSFKSDVEVLQLLHRINAEERLSERRVAASELLHELDRIRKQGYAYAAAAVTPGIGVLAVRLPTPASQPPMTIGIGARVELHEKCREHFLELLGNALGNYQVSPVEPPIASS